MPQEVVVRPKLSVILPFSDTGASVGACLASLDQAAPAVAFELIQAPQGAGPLGALAAGAGRAAGEWCLFVDPAVRFRPGWFEPLATALAGSVAAVQPRLVDRDGRLLDAGGIIGPTGDLTVFGAGWEFADAPPVRCGRQVDFASTKLLLVRRDALVAAGGLASGYASRRYAEADLGLRLRAAGFELRYEPRATVSLAVTEVAGVSGSDGESVDRDRNDFRRSWAALLAGLPAADGFDDARALRPRPETGPAHSVLFIDADAAGVELARRLSRAGVFVAGHFADPAQRRQWSAALAAAGVPVYGPEPLEEPRDPVVAARWRRAQNVALPGLLVRFPFVAAVVAAGALERSRPYLETFAPEARIVPLTPGRPGEAEAALAAVLDRPARDGRQGATLSGPPPQQGLVSVVIDAGNRRDAARATLDSVLRHSDRTVEILVVGDQTASDRTARYNEVLAAARGEFVVLLEDGARVPRRWLDGLLAPLADPRVAAAGPCCNGEAAGQGVPGAPKGSPSDFARWAEDWRRQNRGRTERLSHLAPFCLALRATDLRRAGGFDETFQSPAAAAADVTVRLLPGDRSLVLAREVVIRREPDQPAAWVPGADRARFQRRHGAPLGGEVPFLSACMIVKDEEERLPDCLVSLRGLVDEVLVVDTGSSDATREIARAAGCRVAETPWTDDFAAARNVSLDAAWGEWALVIDADERAVCEDVVGFRSFLAELQLDAVLLPHRSVLGDTKDSPVSEHDEARLYRRAVFRYEGKLHEQIVRLDGRRVEAGTTRRLWLSHEGYRPTVMVERAKRARNDRIARASYEEAAGNRWWPAYTAARSTDDVEDQIRFFSEAVEHLPAHQGYRVDTICGLARALLEAGRLSEALEEARRALDESPRSGLARYLTGACLNRLDRYDEAVEVLRSLAGEDEETDSEAIFRNAGIRQTKAPVELALAYAGIGDLAAMTATLRPVVERDPAGFPDWDIVVSVLRTADPDGWTDEVARLGRAVPRLVLAAARNLPASERFRLVETLAAVSEHLSAGAALFAALELIPHLDEQSTEAAWQRWLPRLDAVPSAARTLIARRLEPAAPAAALHVWESLGNEPGAAVGRSRCHAALGSLAAAIEALDDADLSGMLPADTLFVATLAVNAGDRETAAAVLGTLPPNPEGIAAADILNVAAAIGPDTVAAVRRHVLVGA